MKKWILLDLFLCLAVIAATAYFYIKSSPLNAQENAGVSNQSSTTLSYAIPAQLPGEPSFLITYPSQFGEPEITSAIDNPSAIDPENNGQNITFYKPGSPHNFPYAGSEIFMRISVFVEPLNSGETLQDRASKMLAPQGKATYSSFNVDGHNALIQTIGKSLIYYYIQIDDTSALQLLIAGPSGSGSDPAFSVTKQQVVESIHFSQSN